MRREQGFKFHAIKGVVQRTCIATDSALPRSMRSNRALKERGKKIIYDVVFVGLMLTGLVVLCVFKPRYIGLVVRGYLRAVQRKHGSHVSDEHHT